MVGGGPVPLPEEEALCFRRGDGIDDGQRDLSDPIPVLAHLFLGGPATCLDALDFNDDGVLDLTDAINEIGYLFLGEEPPPAPRDCGVDPTPEDAFGCRSYNSFSG